MADEEDVLKLPLPDRVTHKSWKARVSGYEELAKQLATSDEVPPIWAIDLLRKLPADANMVAQEAGLSVLIAFAEHFPQLVPKVRAAVLGALVEKCIGSNRAGTRQKALDVLLLLIDADVPGPVVEEVIGGLKAKQPKAVAACVFALREVVRLYGAKTVDIKPIMRSLVTLFSHADPTVRSETTQLATEICKWTGKAVFDNVFKELKPVQVKDLADAFDAITERPQQTRFLLSQKPEDVVVDEQPNENAGADANDEGNVDVVEDQSGMDPYDLADPVEILPKINDAFYENLASAKWKERKEALDDLLKMLDTPRLAEGHYQQLISALSKRVVDVNINCAISAANAIEKLAKGLRKLFHPYRPIVMSNLLERTKEKKVTVATALRDALDAVFDSTSLGDVLEDIVSATGNKNPTVKTESTLYLGRCLSKVMAIPSKSETKTIMEAMIKLLDDSTPEVREAAMQCIGTMMKLIGEKVLAPHSDKVDSIKQAKIREYFDNASVKLRGARPAGSAASSKPVSAQGKRTTSVAGKENRPPPAKIPPRTSSMPNLKRTSVAQSGTKPGTAPAAKSKKAASNASSAQPSAPKNYYTEEEAMDLAEEILGSDILTKLSDSNWKVRVEAMDELLEFVKKESTAPADNIKSLSEFVLHVLRNKVWKDSNFQVISRAFQIAQLFADSDHPRVRLSPAAAQIVVPLMAEKVGDIKLRKPAVDALGASMESCGCGFILGLLPEVLQSQKSPKVLTEAARCIKDFLMEFGIQGVNVRSLVEFAKANISNSNAQVRSGIVSMLGVLRIFVGPDIRNLVSDVSPAQLSTIDAEFEKVASAPVPEPTRKMRATGNAAADSATTSQEVMDSSTAPEEAETVDPMEDLFPRADLMSSLPGDTIQKLGDANWKVRKEGLDAVRSTLELSGNKIQPHIVELLGSLKARLSDSNKNLVSFTVELIGDLVAAAGSKVDRDVRVILSDVISTFNDNKPLVRATTTKCLDKCISVMPAESFVGPCAAGLAPDAPNQRREILSWIDSHKEKFTKTNLGDLIKPLVSALQDRSQDVRKAAQAVLPLVCESCGYAALKSRCDDMKPSPQVVALIESCRTIKAEPIPAVAPAVSHVSAPVANVNSPKLLRKPQNTGSTSSLNTTGTRVSRLQLNKKPPSRAASKEEIVEASFPLLTGDMNLKSKRADADRGPNKWTFDAPRKELIDFLREQTEGNFASPIIAQLFSDDHHKEKEFLAGLTALDEYAADLGKAGTQFSLPEEEVQARYLGNSDLILRYLTLRFFDTSTTILLKCLDLLEHLLVIMDKAAYHLSDYEANAFLPFLVSKVGDNKETVRQRIRGILKQFYLVYPASKMFAHLMTGLSAKNSRVRTECLEELGFIIGRNGLSVCNPVKAMPIIASQISDRDSSVRSAAINAVVQAYTVVGEQVFKYLGRLPDKERAMLDEKIKRNKIASPAKPMSRSAPGESSTAYESALDPPQASRPVSGSIESPMIKRNSSRPFSLDLDEVALPSLSGAAQEPIPEPIVSIAPPPTMSMPTPAGHSTEYLMDFILAQITSGDVHQSIDALKQLEKIIQQEPSSLLPHMSSMVNAITLQVRLAFTSPAWNTGTDITTLVRLCKHLVNSLVHMFSADVLASSLRRETLHPLLFELLWRLVDPVSGKNVGEASAQLTRALNVLMLRILENCEKNQIFSTLLDLMDSSVDSIDKSPEDALALKFAELVMKCIWKLTKTLKEAATEAKIDVSTLLIDLHKFLTRSPPNEWKRRASSKRPLGDMPLRTVKTILHELAVALGPRVLDMMGALSSSIDEPRRSHVYTYLSTMLKSAERDRDPMNSAPSTPQSTRPSPADASIGSETSSKRSSVATGLPQVIPTLTEEEAENAIASIFSKVTSKDSTKDGISELYRFHQHYPQYLPKVEAKLQDFGVNFRLFIRRGLERMAEENGHAPASVPRPEEQRVNEAESYQQRLARLQQMFKTAESSSHQEVTENVPPMQSTSSTVVEPKTENNKAPELPSVVALKERLARMKSSMADLKSAESQ